MRYATKTALLDAIARTKTKLDAELSVVPAEREREAGVWGEGWNVVDLVAHLVEWQQMVLSWYEAGTRGERPAIPAPGYSWRETPRLNRTIQAKHAARAMSELRAELEHGHAQCVALAQARSERELLERGVYPWCGSSTLATYLSGATASHYEFATKILRRWKRGVKRG